MEFDATQALDLTQLVEEQDDEHSDVPRGYLRLLAQKELEEHRYALLDGENVIGRGDNCQIQIKSKVLSKEHACIEVINQNHFIYDKDSRNKTRRGKLFLKPEARYELSDRDKLIFGDVICIYEKVRPRLSTAETDDETQVVAGLTQPVEECHIVSDETRSSQDRNGGASLARGERTISDKEESDAESDVSSDLLGPAQSRLPSVGATPSVASRVLADDTPTSEKHGGKDFDESDAFVPESQFVGNNGGHHDESISDFLSKKPINRDDSDATDDDEVRKQISGSSAFVPKKETDVPNLVEPAPSDETQGYPDMARSQTPPPANRPSFTQASPDSTQMLSVGPNPAPRNPYVRQEENALRTPSPNRTAADDATQLLGPSPIVERRNPYQDQTTSDKRTNEGGIAETHPGLATPEMTSSCHFDPVNSSKRAPSRTAVASTPPSMSSCHLMPSILSISPVEASISQQQGIRLPPLEESEVAPDLSSSEIVMDSQGSPRRNALECDDKSSPIISRLDQRKLSPTLNVDETPSFCRKTGESNDVRGEVRMVKMSEAPSTEMYEDDLPMLKLDESKTYEEPVEVAVESRSSAVESGYESKYDDEYKQPVVGEQANRIIGDAAEKHVTVAPTEIDDTAAQKNCGEATQRYNDDDNDDVGIATQKYGGEATQKYGNDLAPPYDVATQSYSGEATQKYCGEATQKYGGESTQMDLEKASESYGEEETAPDWGEVTQKYGGEATQKYGGEATQKYGGEATQKYGGEATQKYGGEATQKYGGEATQKYGGEATQKYGGEATQKYGGEATQKYGGEATQTFDDDDDEFDIATQKYGIEATQNYGDENRQQYGGKTSQTHGDEATQKYAEKIEDASQVSRLASQSFGKQTRRIEGKMTQGCSGDYSEDEQIEEGESEGFDGPTQVYGEATQAYPESPERSSVEASKKLLKAYSIALSIREPTVDDLEPPQFSQRLDSPLTPFNESKVTVKTDQLDLEPPQISQSDDSPDVLPISVEFAEAMDEDSNVSMDLLARLPKVLPRNVEESAKKTELPMKGFSSRVESNEETKTSLVKKEDKQKEDGCISQEQRMEIEAETQMELDTVKESASVHLRVPDILSPGGTVSTLPVLEETTGDEDDEPPVLEPEGLQPEPTGCESDREPPNDLTRVEETRPIRGRKTRQTASLFVEKDSVSTARRGRSRLRGAVTTALKFEVDDQKKVVDTEEQNVWTDDRTTQVNSSELDDDSAKSDAMFEAETSKIVARKPLQGRTRAGQKRSIATEVPTLRRSGRRKSSTAESESVHEDEEQMMKAEEIVLETPDTKQKRGRPAKPKRGARPSTAKRGKKTDIEAAAEEKVDEEIEQTPAKRTRRNVAQPEPEPEPEPVAELIRPRRGRRKQVQPESETRDTSTSSVESRSRGRRRTRNEGSAPHPEPATKGRMKRGAAKAAATERKRGASIDPESESEVGGKRSRLAETGAVSMSPRQRTLALQTKPKVLFTGVVDEKGSKTIETLGGEVVTSPQSCTHLVTDKVRRTVKFLCCLGRGVPIVNCQWLEKCRQARKFVDYEPYIIADPDTESHYKFKLKDSIEAAKESPLFSGWRIHVTKSVQPVRPDMAEIIKSAGGTPVATMPKCTADDLLIVSCEDDERTCSLAIHAGITIVSSECILTGLLQQKLDVESYRLFTAAAAENEAATASSAQKSKSSRKKRKR